MSEPVVNEELEALRAQRAALREKREGRETSRAEADELARLKREIADEEAIAKAECELGPIGKDVATVHSRDHGVIIVRRPTHASYRMMIDAVGTGKQSLTVINERFAYSALVHPDKLAFETILKTESGLLERVANAAAKLAGLVVEEVQGK